MLWKATGTCSVSWIKDILIFQSLLPPPASLRPAALQCSGVVKEEDFRHADEHQGCLPVEADMWLRLIWSPWWRFPYYVLGNCDVGIPKHFSAFSWVLGTIASFSSSSGRAELQRGLWLALRGKTLNKHQILYFEIHCDPISPIWTKRLLFAARA